MLQILLNLATKPGTSIEYTCSLANPVSKNILLLNFFSLKNKGASLPQANLYFDRLNHSVTYYFVI